MTKLTREEILQIIEIIAQVYKASPDKTLVDITYDPGEGEELEIFMPKKETELVYLEEMTAIAEDAENIFYES